MFAFRNCTHSELLAPVLLSIDDMVCSHAHTKYSTHVHRSKRFEQEIDKNMLGNTRKKARVLPAVVF